MKTIHLTPTGPFSEIPRSDTLFGAICEGIKLSRGEAELESILSKFDDRNPPFLISSVFPSVEHPSGDERLCLLPKPRLSTSRVGGEGASAERIEAIQAWKRIEYIPAPVFAALASGELTVAGLIEKLEASQIVLDLDGRECEHEHDRGILLPTAVEHPYETQMRVRNAVNRLTGATEGNLFERESVFFTEDAGLFVCVKGAVGTVVEALSVLQDRGIGGGKSIGQGTFRLDGVRTIDGFPLAEETDRFCTLSFCVPHRKELADLVEGGHYAVETRKGVVAENADATWKKRVLALAEGSMLPHLGESEFHGHNPIVAEVPEYDIQQYGFAFPVGFVDLYKVRVQRGYTNDGR